MDYKAEFIRIFSENVSRPGAQQLLDWLATTDFYTAPASTRFHGACECGLVMHSINVYNVLMSRFYTEEDNKESFTLVSLLHDLCKANYYKSGFRNVKNDATGQWEKVPSYSCLLYTSCPACRQRPLQGSLWRRCSPGRLQRRRRAGKARRQGPSQGPARGPPE